MPSTLIRAFDSYTSTDGGNTWTAPAAGRDAAAAAFLLCHDARRRRASFQIGQHDNIRQTVNQVLGTSGSPGTSNANMLGNWTATRPMRRANRILPGPAAMPASLDSRRTTAPATRQRLLPSTATPGARLLRQDLFPLAARSAQPQPRSPAHSDRLSHRTWRINYGATRPTLFKHVVDLARPGSHRVRPGYQSAELAEQGTAKGGASSLPTFSGTTRLHRRPLCVRLLVRHDQMERNAR